MRIYISFLASLLVLANACTSQRIVRPLEKGQSAVSAHLGGPLIGFAGTTIPIPFTSLSYAKGITDSLTVFGGTQLTNLAYQNLHLALGAAYGILKPNGWIPGVSLSATLNFLSDFRQFNARLYPQLDANVYWNYGTDHLMYVGTTNWVELNNTRAHNETQEKRLLSGIQFGNTFSTKKWMYTIDSKWLAPSRNTNDLTINYKTYSFGGEPKGAVGLYFGITRKF